MNKIEETLRLPLTELNGKFHVELIEALNLVNVNINFIIDISFMLVLRNILPFILLTSLNLCFSFGEDVMFQTQVIITLRLN